MLYLKDLDGTENARLPNMSKIGMSMAALRPKLNQMSQSKYGNKSLRADKEEIVFTRLSSASTKKQKLHRHKDSYIHDPNNELDGMSLRKLSMVIFLNENLD